MCHPGDFYRQLSGTLTIQLIENSLEPESVTMPCSIRASIRDFLGMNPEKHIS
jgi:hypothetical protein